MIEARGLSKRYGATVAVDGLTFNVRSSMVTGFLGPNGSGKSTTMRLILGLDAPDAGQAGVVLVTKAGASAELLAKLLDAYAAEPDAVAVDVLLCGIGEQEPMLRDGRADVALLRSPWWCWRSSSLPGRRSRPLRQGSPAGTASGATWTAAARTCSCTTRKSRPTASARWRKTSAFPAANRRRVPVTRPPFGLRVGLGVALFHELVEFRLVLGLAQLGQEVDEFAMLVLQPL